MMTALLSTAIIKGNEIEYFISWIEAWPEWIWLWWLRIAALLWTIVGILSNIYNGGHLGGAVTGLLMGLTELHLRGSRRFLFTTTWLLVISAWAWISSNLDLSHEDVFSPDLNGNLSVCASQCLPCVEVCDAYDLCTSQCHQCVSACKLCVSECYLDTGNCTQ